MAPLFAAYDCPCYQKIISHHIGSVVSYPTELIRCFKAGGFTVKIKDGLGHAVALDEAHEMCVNRDMKMAIVRLTLSYLKKTMFYFPYRIKAHKQLISQLFPESTKTCNSTLFDNSASIKQWDQNVIKMRSLINEHNVFEQNVHTNRGLINAFTGTQATNEQSHDLLNARVLGQLDYTNYITHHIIQSPIT